LKLFGREYTFQSPIKAIAPALPPGRTDKALTEILPPFGTNPPQRPLAEAPELGERTIHNDPRELWYLALPYKLTPKQVIQILRDALGGDLWQQWQLLSLMLDTWPRLRKCQHEVRTAVAAAKYVVRPYVEDEGDEPTQSAIDKAATVRRAMRAFRPDPTTDESEFFGMVYACTDSVLNGLSMVELMYYRKGLELLPRAAAWVHPRHFTFGNDGRLAVFDDMYNRLNYALAQTPGEGPDGNKFLIPQYTSRSGSSLGGGLMRPLAWGWSARVFGQEWMLNHAQKFGNPFLDISYKVGTPQAELDRLKGYMADAGNQGFLMHPEGSEAQIHPAQSLGPDNAHRNILEMTDVWCAELILGQESTTKQTPGKLGNEGSQEQVKREVIQGVANWVARTVLTAQFAAAICRVNYGTDDECPEIEADFTEESDPQAEAARDQVFLSAGVPMVAEEFYKRHNLTMPQDEDIVIKGGTIGKQGDLKAQAEEARQAALNPQAASGEPDEDDPKQVTEAKLRKALRKATDEEVDELAELVTAAKAKGGEINGEWESVKVKVQEIYSRRLHG
jgi:phage gp29-like protein